MLFPACGLFTSTQSVRATLVAVGVQQTGLARTVTALAQSGLALTQAAPVASESQIPAPALTATLAPVSAPTQVNAAVFPDERLMKSAKILLFEDMSASKHIRYVKEALDRAGYFYLDVGSATGWFKTQLLSPVDWDLIIAAAEARREFGGEFFEYIDQHLEKGAGAVVEYWDFDLAPQGMVKPLLDRCGVQIQADWFEPEMRVFFWLVPDNPILNEPNKIPPMLRNAERLWVGDVGDLMKIETQNGKPTGDAMLLAGTSMGWKDDHGVVASCVGGRLILQTFSSHEYQHDDMVPLWQNYVYQALKSHFAFTKATLPTPAVTALPAGNAPTPSGQTPGPEYGYAYSCGGLLTAQLMEAPRYQKDLFEHHASGTFLILRPQLINETDSPIQIWDQDYSLEGNLNDKPISYKPHKEATGYLYIDNPTNLYQDLIQGREHWRTAVAFDIDPQAKDLAFVIRPGSEFNEQVCEVRIPLSK